MLRACVLIVACLSAIPGYAAEKRDGCTIVFAASGGSYRAFTEQVQQLSAHLRRQKVRLIDLNHWQTEWPYTTKSGREKARLRDMHRIARFGARAKAQAVLLNADDAESQRYTNTLDLVDMLMDCPTR